MATADGVALVTSRFSSSQCSAGAGGRQMTASRLGESSGSFTHPAHLLLVLSCIVSLGFGYEYFFTPRVCRLDDLDVSWALSSFFSLGPCLVVGYHEGIFNGGDVNGR
jgi:hypothetical protein